MAARTVVIAFASLMLLVSPAGADETAPDNLANACAGCHGTDGKSPGLIVSINELSADEIASMMRSFKNDEIVVTVMNRIAKGYTEAEIEAIANHFGGM